VGVDVRAVGEGLVALEVGAEDRCDRFPAGGRVLAEVVEVLE
jgi:hypothetical protein